MENENFSTSLSGSLYLSARSKQDRALDGLIDHALEEIRLSKDQRPDTVFGKFAHLNALFRSSLLHEGHLVEKAIGQLARAADHLDVITPARSLPIVPAAVEALRCNEWAELKSVRLDSKVYSSQRYKPDAIIVDRRKRRLLIVDVKRSLATYNEQGINALFRKMMAVAMIAVDWLYHDGIHVSVDDVEICIIDCADVSHDKERGIFSVSEIDRLFGTSGIADSIARLRAQFAVRVQKELEAACLIALPSELQITALETAAEARIDENELNLNVVKRRRGRPPRAAKNAGMPAGSAASVYKIGFARPAMNN